MRTLSVSALLQRAEDSFGVAVSLVKGGIAFWWLLSGLIWLAVGLCGDGDLDIPPSLSLAMHWAFGLVVVVAVVGGLAFGSGTVLVRAFRRREYRNRHASAV